MQRQIISAGDMSGNITSKVVDLGDVNLGSIQAVFSGAPVGTLQLEISNDIISNTADPNTAVTNWTTYTPGVYAVAAAGNYMFNVSNMGYKWLRLSFAFTSGTGVLNATLEVKDAVQ